MDERAGTQAPSEDASRLARVVGLPLSSPLSQAMCHPSCPGCRSTTGSIEREPQVIIDLSTARL